MKRKISVYSLLTVFLLLFVNISYVPSGSTVPVPNPDIYTDYTVYSVELVDPARNYDTYGIGLNQLVYETLIHYEGNTTEVFKGVLANSWAITLDGLNLTFNLRDDVYFHDRVNFNAYVMKYSLDRALMMYDANGPAFFMNNPILGVPTLWNYNNINVSQAVDYLNAGGIKVIDDYTLQITLGQKFAPILNILSSPFASAVSPKAIIENVPASYTTNVNDDDFGMVPLDTWFPSLTNWTKLGLPISHDPAISGVVPGIDQFGVGNQHVWMETHAVGTGPYKLDKFVSGGDVRFVKNLYWREDFSSHSPDIVLWKMEYDENERRNLIFNATADQIYHSVTDANEFIYPNGTFVYPDINVFVVPRYLVTFNTFNMHDTIPTTYIQEDPSSTYNGTDTNRFSTGSEKATKENPFTALTFRKAFAAAFDYNKYILNVTGGVFKRLEGIVPEGMLGHADDLIDNGFIPSYSPSVAEILFNQAGWRGNISLFYNEGSIGRETAALLLKDTIESLNVGININVTGLAFSDFQPIHYGPENPIYLISGWGADYPDPDNFLSNVVHSSKSYYHQFSNYTNAQLDILIDQQAGEMFEALRSATIGIIEEELAQDYPWIYVTQSQRIIVARDWIQGFAESGSFNPVFEVPRYQFLSKPDEWPRLTTITETTTETETSTETTNTTIIEYVSITETVTSTHIITTTEIVTNTVTETGIETITETITTSSVFSISTTDGGFESLVILGTIGLMGVLLKRRKK
ncbi:MAG: ABC transporter substrate-binding protein [Candidatus Hodarchaeales archaeon]|jgi:peptide/nickel transport system substrate-binding protein